MEIISGGADVFAVSPAFSTLEAETTLLPPCFITEWESVIAVSLIVGRCLAFTTGVGTFGRILISRNPACCQALGRGSG